MFRPVEFHGVVVTIRLKTGWVTRCLSAVSRLPRPELLARSLATVGLGFALCTNTTADVPAVQFRPVPPKVDSRIIKLERFFQLYSCPEPRHVAEYVHAADLYQLDYRLLPAVSVRETRCGVEAWENNRWGYHPHEQAFRSVAEGIDFMGRVLSEGFYYKGKVLEEKLLMYNHRPAYTDEVKWIMRQIE